MTDDPYIAADLARERLERLSQASGDLGPTHQALVQGVLEACSVTLEQFEAIAESRERLLVQSREDQRLLKELTTRLEQERKIQQRLLQPTKAHLAYLDADFNFVQVNGAYARGCSYPVEALIGRNHFELFPDAENQALFEHVRDTGEPLRVCARPLEFPDQPERGITYWDWALEPAKDEDGRVEGLVLSLVDVTERAQTEQALRESEASWRSLAEISPDHILMLDTDLRIQFANFASPGLTVNELMGTPLYTLVEEEAQAEVRALLEGVSKTGISARYETTYRMPTGDDIYYESRVVPRTLSDSDKIVGLTVSARDITERKLAEQALGESEEKLRALFEILPVGVSVLDGARNIRFTNPALARILRLSQDGLKRGQYTQRTYLRADGTEMPPDQFPSTRAFLEQRPVRDVEICVVLEDGERIWTSVSADPVPSVDWRVIVTTIDITDRKLAEAALSQARDELEQRVEERTAALKHLNRALRSEIAERQRAEEELRDSEERFRQIAENTEDIIWLIEPDSGRFLYISPAYQRVLGQPGRKIPERIDQLWADVHPDDRRLLPQGQLEAWIGQDLEFRIAAPGGIPRWIRARAFPIRDHQGQIYRVGGIASDITEEKRALAALLEAERMAIAGRMAASLAHEINNPLQAAIGCLDLSLEQLDQGKVPNQHLQVTAKALDRASRVVAQLRGLHYPREVEAKRATDLNALLENLLLLIQKRCIDQGVEVAWQGAPHLPPVLLAPDAIEQVCLNLLLNALEAMPDGGRLQVSTVQSEDPAGVQIEFSDSGCGIPRAALERVFEPLYSTKRNSLGLGLFISRNIVHEHGGHLEVHSQEGEETTFSLWLPLPGQEAS